MTSTHPAVLELIALAAAVTAVVTLWRLVLRPAHRTIRRVVDFLDDWNGAPPRPGRPEIKPMPDRLDEIEETIKALAATMERFQKESSEDRAAIRDRLDDLEGS